jgi:hypothetical protein
MSRTTYALQIGTARPYEELPPEAPAHVIVRRVTSTEEKTCHTSAGSTT